MKHANLLNRTLTSLAALLSAVLPPAILAAETPAATATFAITVDAGRTNGMIRALHGVNGGPICYGGLVNLTEYHKALGFPLNRLHDATWPSRNVVDIHAVFPDFKADPDSPASYCFAPTDDYVKSIVDTGSGILYRLGESIEHTKNKYYVHKPADYDQWTKICLGIIRHYNEGWANGFHYNIRYWEIWNEPTIGLAQWDGSAEDYYRLYATASKAIKAKYPELKVGGPAIPGSGGVVEGRFKPSPFVHGFLDYCRSNSVPLDFYSYHMYLGAPQLTVSFASGVRVMLNEYGFSKTELHLNEWNYTVNKKQFAAADGARGAAFVASVLMGLQDAPIDMANFYTADTGWWGLFNAHGEPKKNYYAFRAFKTLVDHPARVTVTGGKAGEVYTLAGLSKDASELAILVSHYRIVAGRIALAVENLPWTGRCEYEVFRVDADKNLESAGKQEAEGNTLTLEQEFPSEAVLLITIRKKS